MCRDSYKILGFKFIVIKERTSKIKNILIFFLLLFKETSLSGLRYWDFGNDSDGYALGKAEI